MLRFASRACTACRLHPSHHTGASRPPSPVQGPIRVPTEEMTPLLPDHAGPCCAELEDIGAVHCGALPRKRSQAKGAYYTVRVDQKLLASHGTSSVILCDSHICPGPEPGRLQAVVARAASARLQVLQITEGSANSMAIHGQSDASFTDSCLWPRHGASWLQAGCECSPHCNVLAHAAST